MATQDTINKEDEMEQLINAFSDSFSKEMDKQMQRLHANQYAGMKNGDIAIRIGDTVYETDVPTVLLGGAIGAAVGFIGYKVVTSLL